MSIHPFECQRNVSMLYSSYETFIKRLFCEILARDSHLLCYIIRHNFLKSINTSFYEPCDIWIVFNLIHQPW